MRISCFSYSFAQGEYFFLTLLQGFETNTDIADISRTVRIRNQFSLAHGENIYDLSKTVTDSRNNRFYFACNGFYRKLKNHMVSIGSLYRVNSNPPKKVFF